MGRSFVLGLLVLPLTLSACDGEPPHGRRTAATSLRANAEQLDCRADCRPDALSVAEYRGRMRGINEPPKEASPATDKYRGRDGVAEATRDFQCGRPLKIYTNVFNGVAPELISHGIAFCSPAWSDPFRSPGRHLRLDRMFHVLEEAAFYEGAHRTPEQQARAASAVAFAKAYNGTTYRLRPAEVKEVCPCVGAPDAVLPSCPPRNSLR